ncbi:BACON domain-containing protein [Porphyromonas macacae]|uniref:BACON domain-containing protein n=1 Tax=Porphyromonas macacae TaxID=28115 RepID=UPI0024AE0D6E|nr:BACON domain-containing protein [Porphyromonas macacae]
MKSKLYILLGLIAMLFVAPSCDKGNDYEEAELKVSETSLTFAKKGEEKVVTIETNKEKWNAMAGVEWLTLVREGKSLKIKAAPNAQPAERKGEVLVMSGDASVTIAVTQTATDIIFDIDQTEISLPQEGGGEMVAVTTNSENWSVELEKPADNWVKFSLNKKAGTINIKADANDGALRVTKLIAKNGAILKEIIVKQQGVASVKYILPLFKNPVGAYELISFEKKRGSFLIGHSNALPGWGVFEESYYFCTPSTVFPDLQYAINIESKKTAYIRMAGSDIEAVKSPDYKAMLKENGFTITDENENGFIGENEEAGFDIKVDYNVNGFSVVTFKAILKQPKDYPTFKEFPYGPYQWLNNPKWKYAQIKAEELKNGFTVDAESNSQQFPSEVAFLLLKEEKKETDITFRGYFFDWNKSTPEAKRGLNIERIDIFENLNLGAWEEDGKYYLTKEFKALLKKEGFVFLKSGTGIEFYLHKEKNLVAAVRGVKFSDILDGAPVFSINFFLHEKDGNAAALLAPTKKASEARDKFIKELIERIAESDKYLNKK